MIASEVMKEGVPVDLILDTATLFDLVVVGLRTFFHFETRQGDGELLSKILGSATTPILAVPYKPREMKKVMIAFDGFGLLPLVVCAVGAAVTPVQFESFAPDGPRTPGRAWNARRGYIVDWVRTLIWTLRLRSSLY